MPVEPAATSQQQSSISSDRPNDGARSADQVAPEQGGVVASKPVSEPASKVSTEENLAPAVEVADKPSHATVEAPSRAATSIAPLGSNSGVANGSQAPSATVIEVPEGPSHRMRICQPKGHGLTFSRVGAQRRYTHGSLALRVVCGL